MRFRWAGRLGFVVFFLLVIVLDESECRFSGSRDPCPA